MNTEIVSRVLDAGRKLVADALFSSKAVGVRMCMQTHCGESCAQRSLALVLLREIDPG